MRSKRLSKGLSNPAPLSDEQIERAEEISTEYEAEVCCLPGDECQSEASEEEQTIEIHVPGPDSPGYFRRIRDAAKLREKMAQDERKYGKGTVLTETVELMAELLVPFSGSTRRG